MLTRWSLSKLHPHLIETGIVSELGTEALRQILRGAGHQRTRSWKWSPGPHFQAKADRVL